MKDKIAIYESKTSEKVVGFANDGYGMSARWWNESHKAQLNGLLWGIYQVPSGLRRNLK